MLERRVSTQAALCLLGCLHVVAFASLLLQGGLLFGSSGLQPISAYLHLAAQQVLPARSDYGRHLWPVLASNPTLLWLHGALGMAPEALFALLCVGGLAAGMAVACGTLHPALFAALWACYQSVTAVGQAFLPHAGDAILLEVTFACIWLSPVILRPRPPSPPQPHGDAAGAAAGAAGAAAATPETLAAQPALLLLRWLLFKLLLLSSSTKAAVVCAGLPGLAQCYRALAAQGHPHALTWLQQALPAPVAALAAALALLELPASFLVLWLAPAVQRWVAALLLGVQLARLLLGSSGLASLAAALLCVALLDDGVVVPWLLRLRRWLHGDDAAGDAAAADAAAADDPAVGAAAAAGAQLSAELLAYKPSRPLQRTGSGDSLASLATLFDEPPPEPTPAGLAGLRHSAPLKASLAAAVAAAAVLFRYDARVDGGLALCLTPAQLTALLRLVVPAAAAYWAVACARAAWHAVKAAAAAADAAAAAAAEAGAAGAGAGAGAAPRKTPMAAAAAAAKTPKATVAAAAQEQQQQQDGGGGDGEEEGGEEPPAPKTAGRRRATSAKAAPTPRARGGRRAAAATATDEDDDGDEAAAGAAAAAPTSARGRRPATAGRGRGKAAAAAAAATIEESPLPPAAAAAAAADPNAPTPPPQPAAALQTPGSAAASTARSTAAWQHHGGGKGGKGGGSSRGGGGGGLLALPPALRARLAVAWTAAGAAAVLAVLVLGLPAVLLPAGHSPAALRAVPGLLPAYRALRGLGVVSSARAHAAGLRATAAAAAALPGSYLAFELFTSPDRQAWHAVRFAHGLGSPGVGDGTAGGSLGASLFSAALRGPYEPRLAGRLAAAGSGALEDNTWLAALADKVLEGAPELAGVLEEPPRPHAWVRADLVRYAPGSLPGSAAAAAAGGAGAAAGADADAAGGGAEAAGGGAEAAGGGAEAAGGGAEAVGGGAEAGAAAAGAAAAAKATAKAPGWLAQYVGEALPPMARGDEDLKAVVAGLGVAPAPRDGGSLLLAALGGLPPALLVGGLLAGVAARHARAPGGLLAPAAAAAA